jgi:hypothetical protein
MFVFAMRSLQHVRNLTSHSPPSSYKDAYVDNLPVFVTCLLGWSFWALHPLVADLKVVPWGHANGLTGKRLQGSWEFIPTPTWSWEGPSNLQVNPLHVYQFLVEPEAEDKALAISLYPMARITREKEPYGLWLAHDPPRNLYRNLGNGSIHKFDDVLSEWWNRHSSRQSPVVHSTTIIGQGVSTISGKPQTQLPVSPAQNSMTGESLAVQRNISEFYLPTDRVSDRTTLFEPGSELVRGCC